MVRYIRDDELYHHGVKGQKKGLRRYQYPNGSLTPLGREHYGYGPARIDPRDPADRRIAKLKAIGQTIKGYVTRDYRARFKRDSVTKRAEAALKKELDEREKKAEEKSKAKETAAKEKADKKEEAKKESEEKKQAKLESKKREAEEKAKKAEEEKKLAEKAESEQYLKSHRGKHWREFTDEELREYARRANLEAEATRAMLQKLDAPRQIVEKLVGYGRVGLQAYNTYKDWTGSIDRYKKQNLVTNANSVKIANQIMNKYAKKYKGAEKMSADEVFKLKNDMFKDMQILDAMTKCENYMKPTYFIKPDNQQKGDNNKPKGDNNQPNGNKKN